MIQRFKQTLTYLSGIHEERKIKQIAQYDIAGKYKRIYFYHIRKAAGKSITDIILSVEGKDHYKRNADMYNAPNHRIIYNDKVMVGWHPILIEKGNYYYAFSHIPYHQIKIPPDTFTFTCLRDPVDRVISFYKMLKKLKNDKTISRVQHKETKFIGKSFDEFIINLPKHHLMNQLYMFSKNYSIEEAYNRIIGLSYFLFVDDFENGINELGNRLELKLNKLHSDKLSIDEEI